MIRVCLFLVIVAGFFLRFFKLDFQPLWMDELATRWYLQATSWTELWQTLTTKEITNPPLFYLLEYGARSFLPDTEWGLRAMAAIFGCVTLLASVLLVPIFKRPPLALVFAVLLTTSYQAIFFAQEARSYSLTIAFSFITSLLWFRVFYFKDSKPITVASLIVSSVLLSYSHYFGTLLVFAQGMSLFFILKFLSRGNLAKTWLVVYGSVFLAFLPWLNYVYQATGRENFWISPVRFNLIFQLPREYFGQSALLEILFYSLLSAYFIFSFFDKNLRKPILICFGWFAAVFLVSYFLSVFVTPFLTARYMVALLPVLYLAIAMMIDSLKNNKAKWGFLSLWTVLSIGHLAYSKMYSKTVKSDLRSVSNQVIEWDKENPISQIIGCCYVNELCNYYFEKQSPHLRVSNQACTADEINHVINKKPSSTIVILDFRNSIKGDLIDHLTEFKLKNQTQSLNTKAWLFQSLAR